MGPLPCVNKLDRFMIFYVCSWNFWGKLLDLKVMEMHFPRDWSVTFRVIKSSSYGKGLFFNSLASFSINPAPP